LQLHLVVILQRFLTLEPAINSWPGMCYNKVRASP
jgi:hypothetical protein